jgi:hypothetical protein
MSYLLCTNCRSDIKPVVALDIDGTMGGFHEHFMKFATGYMYGKPDISPPVYDGVMAMRDWFCGYFDVSDDVWRDIKLAYRQGGLKRTMPSHGWGKMVAKACQDAGAEVWVTTTRPYLRLDNIDPDTRFWLDREGIVYDGLIYDEQKYERLDRLVGADRVAAVVEDLPEEFREAAKLFGESVPILYRGNHNAWMWGELHPMQIAHEGETVWRACQSRISHWYDEWNNEGTGAQVGER